MAYSEELIVRLNFIDRGRSTRRFHAMEMLDHQRVDAHSFGVAAFTTIIVPNCDWERRARLLLAAMAHDLPEHITGDIPGPAKRILSMREHLHAYEEALLGDAGLLVRLDERDQRVLNIADSADGVAHCIAERRKGNTNARRAFLNYWDYLNDEQKLFNPLLSTSAPVEEGEETLRVWLSQNWTAANGGEW